ncbi:MAG: hypothetical protein SOZ08_06865 [Erysipelotrichaceae bacterium]|nr:hypothetical protein [Erysipelotrichaceae bacterium]
MDLTYTLVHQDLVSYYQEMLADDEEVFRFRWRLRLLIPAGIFAIWLIVFRTLTWFFISVAFTALWFLLVDYVIYPQYEKRIVNHYCSDEKHLQEIHAHLDQSGVFIAGRRKALETFGELKNSFVLVFTDNTNLIVPKHVLQIEQQDEMRGILNQLQEVNNAAGKYEESTNRKSDI